MPEPLFIPDDWWFAVEHHRPVCVRLRELGIPAYEEGTGGGHFHVAFSRGQVFVLADCNYGFWQAGLYVSLDDVFESQFENLLIESELTDEAAPEAVVDWLLSLPTEIPKEK